MNIKYLLSRLIYKLRKGLKLDFPRKKIINNKSPRFFLLGTIEYMNYGDHAINVGEYDFFNRKNIDFIEIPESYLDETFELLLNYSNDNDVFYFQGGGNMGDVWTAQEKWRQRLLSNFPNHKIVFFPQSISYSSLDSEIYRETKNLSEHAKNLTILLRDKVSFDFVQNNFPENVHKFLVPDMAMTLSNNVVHNIKYDVLMLFRSDIEKENNIIKNELTNWLTDNSHLKINVSDTVRDSWKYIDKNNRRLFLFKKLREFNQSKVVVTDRLHGLILSFISDTPVIVFDNNNHKIRNFYQTWLKQSQNIYFVDESVSVKTIANKIIEFTQQEKNFKDNSTHYKDLVDKID